MGTRTMKQDIFILKAIETKGYDIDELIKLSDKEIEALPLANKIIEGIKNHKARGGQTPDQIAERIADMMMEPVDSDVEAVPEYVEQSEEQNAVLVEITENKAAEETVSEDAEPTVEIVHEVAKQEDVETVKEALQQKEFRSFASYMKLLKSAVPDAILGSIESTVISELIDARIAEVKAATPKD